MDQIRAMGVVRLVGLFGMIIGLVMTLAFFGFNLGGGSQALLYSSLQPADAAAASAQLDEAGIPYEFRNGGTAIYVPRGQVDEARVRVASGGALGFGSVGYEIFDESDALGATSFVQNMNAKRALEGELARTIQSLDVVTSARVHLVLPERRLFQRDTQTPTASIVIGTRGELTSAHAGIIRNVVASAVDGMSPSDITLADTSGRLLASPTEGGALGAAAFDDRRSSFEEQMRRRVLDLVEGVVGSGAVRVQVSAELNRESMTQNSQTLDPESRVVLSRQAEESTESDQERDNPNRVSASENLPGEDQAGGDEAVSSRSANRTNETTNYEYSRTTATRVIEAGGVERLSVAVAVDGVLTTGEDGTVQWQARSAEEMTAIAALVRRAIGYDETRGDTVEVSNVQFARADPNLGTSAPSGFSFGKDDIMRVAEIAVMFITAILIIFMVARPLAKGAGGGAPALAAVGAGAGAASAQSGANAVAGPEQQEAIPQSSDRPRVSIPAPHDDGIDISQIDGRVKASSVKKVAGIVDQHPEESMSILRSWMHEA
ncbi:flagellar basal-body MS-ring/collar protein FliF [Hyphobacterium marinum]|uniref:Flagellar M-ring protein n=1 Tax=Hyphobacterium marinum TaxID=3116574 RepID=A0ABU7LXB0_9PROT|nr:flagellar basal-body MS-ring/collar protein FliF [Hyphobacterium sp. Y6023]MEE2566197.1 flagellar basal-body MS-ring/collar protein FliF [Hyphobacterium sp. Y6023]